MRANIVIQNRWQMTRYWRISVLPLVALLALTIGLPAALAAASRQIALRPSKAYPAGRGTAQYEQQPAQREFQIEIEHVRSLARHRVAVFVNGTKIGTARVSSRGVAELQRNTERGQRVPRVKAGTTVRVRTRAGTMIVSGRF